jgi:hypothetical protein
MRSPRRIKLMVAIAVAIVGALALLLIRPGPKLPTSGLRRASLELHYPRMGHAPDEAGNIVRMVKVKGETSDPALLTQLVSLLNSGREVGSHKCMSHGILTLEYEGGLTRSLSFIRGHHAGYYEVATNRIFYRFPRKAFVDLAVAMSIEADDMPQ